MPTITRRNPFESPGRPPVAIANSPRSAHIERQSALLEEDLELQRVRVAERDARCAEVAGGPVGKVHRVAGPIIVLDPFPLVAHFGVVMPATGPSGPSGRQSRS